MPAPASMLPCTLITFPTSCVVPGANEVTQPRVLLGSPWALTPILFRPSTKSARCCVVSRPAKAFGAPPASVGPLRLAAISNLLVVRYAAITCAAV